jgi:flagellar hook-length control protein FliK
VPASATAGAAAGAAGAPASTALSLAGLPTGPAAGPDAPARSAGPAEAAAHFTLSPSIDSPTFAPALGLQLSVLARDGIEQARMQLNPQEMGPIGVQLTVLGQQVQVEFTAEHARTRQVLEQSLQQLASALGDAGFTMTGGSVFQQARDGREGAQGREPGQPGQPGTGLDTAGRTAADEALAEPSASMRPRATRGLVDLYA